MSELKCPFCGKKLFRTLVNNPYGGPGRMDALKCNDCDCALFGTVKLWEEFIDTKKKLDICEGALEEYKDWFNKSQERLKIAVDAIEYIQKNCMTIIETESVCRYALERIESITKGVK